MNDRDYSVVEREDAVDVMAAYPGFGELRFYTDALEAEQVAFTWRLMPSGTGGRGSHGHRHFTQEEIVFVVSGIVTFKIGDDVFQVGPKSSVRIAPHAVRSIHNDTDSDAEVILCSIKVDDLGADVEKVDDFWPN
ncbi:MAG: cupin domain-containing protein [Actinomycetota bacterium]|nr:cupin domain-containing protein [Actinomycetota bacterium]